jgi:glycosyltransferase involved in cell wall biosynthesis
VKIAFFDFNYNFGGAPKGSVYLMRRLADENVVHIIDVYGRCQPYLDAIKRMALPCHILLPNSSTIYIGYKQQPLKRFLRSIIQLPDFVKLRVRLIRKVEEIKPDVILVNNEKSLAFVLSSKKLRRLPIVVYIRCWATRDQISLAYLWALKHKVSAIIAHARDAISQLSHRGIKSNKLYYVPNTIDIDDVKFRSSATIEDSIGGKDLYPVILLSSARLEPRKGYVAAIKALALLCKRGYNPALWLPGAIAVGGVHSYVDDLKELIKALDLQNNVFFLGWRNDMPAIINASNIVILPSHTEGFPRVILEAMLLKRPVVATPVGGIPDAIIDSGTGFLFPIDDENELADKLCTLISNDKLRKQVVENAYKKFVREFTPELNTLKVNEVLTSVVVGL